MSLVSVPPPSGHADVPQAQRNTSALQWESYVLDMRPRYPLLVRGHH